MSAVISNHETNEKYSIDDHVLIPYVAVLDPFLILGLPKHITSITGMDALTHVVEAYIGGSTTIEPRAYCKKAVKLIFDNLYEAYRNGSNIYVRYKMQQASYLAGVADEIGIGEGESSKRKAELFIEAIEELNFKMGILNKIDGILEKDIKDMVKRVQCGTIPLYPVHKIFKDNELINLYDVIRGM